MKPWFSTTFFKDQSENDGLSHEEIQRNAERFCEEANHKFRKAGIPDRWKFEDGLYNLYR